MLEESDRIRLEIHPPKKQVMTARVYGGDYYIVQRWAAVRHIVGSVRSEGRHSSAFESVFQLQNDYGRRDTVVETRVALEEPGIVLALSHWGLHMRPAQVGMKCSDCIEEAPDRDDSRHGRIVSGDWLAVERLVESKNLLE